ncbi:MAG: SDR family NAD(P)-dependent oxidoreductase [Betaproteobacteria bacterium]|jgi:NAD(P)-dependent dehydrogenase (short-subunit alcohol dehydrogenase family)
MNQHVALVTGGTSGIGLVCAKELVRQGFTVFVASRSSADFSTIEKSVQGFSGKISFIPLDLGDFSSVRSCAEQFLSMNLPLHVLVNNAGVAGIKGKTQSGFELAFGVNHVGHFLLTQLLLPKLKESAPARVVIVASRAHARVESFDFSGVQMRTKTFFAWPEYCQSKLANVLFHTELAKQLEGTGVNSYAVHPGVVGTNLWRHTPRFFQSLIKSFSLSSEEGAKTLIYCASSPQTDKENGYYYDKCKITNPSKLSSNADLAKQLWLKSEEWTQ